MSDLNERIKTLIVLRLNLRMKPETIHNDAPLFSTENNGLGLDSIDALDLAVGLFEEFEVEVGQNDMHVFANVATLACFVEGKLAAERQVA